jgi:GxxExxY protein
VQPVVREDEVARLVLDAAFAVHSMLGPGLFESVYEAILAYELSDRGLSVHRQVPIPISYRGLRFEEGFRADLIVADCLVVELKSVETLAPVHAKQVLTQLRLGGFRLGLVINFGQLHLKDGIHRVANGLPE